MEGLTGDKNDATKPTTGGFHLPARARQIQNFNRISSVGFGLPADRRRGQGGSGTRPGGACLREAETILQRRQEVGTGKTLG
ncbi:hypothetical protein HY933_00375 [Candidatus Falkowbacteria bacterium]|nr:hypothetical protein [Candidatus Falkowbacteria bacterium]